MIVLKVIGVLILSSLMIGFIFVKYALRHGMHVPTNQEIIVSTKAYMNREKMKTEAKGPVKASDIKRLSR